MSTYLIGDIHGCNNELQSLLKKVFFNPKKDVLWVTGDLISRGPNPIEVLNFFYSIKKSIRIVLGNHDIHLLAFFAGIKNKKNYKYENLSKRNELKKIICWLRFQPFIQIDKEKKLIMTHAGISPQWDLKTMQFCAKELHEELSSDRYIDFLKSYYENNIDCWKKNFSKAERLNFSINVLTRMRFCFLNKKLSMGFSGSPFNAPKNLKPWFLFSNFVDFPYTIAFGHWATLDNFNIPNSILPLDTGCCWGNKLSMFRWEDKKFFFQKSYLRK